MNGTSQNEDGFVQAARNFLSTKSDSVKFHASTKLRTWLHKMKNVDDHTGRTGRFFLFDAIYRIFTLFVEYATLDEQKHEYKINDERKYNEHVTHKNIQYDAMVTRFFLQMAAVNVTISGETPIAEEFKSIVSGVNTDADAITPMRHALEDLIVMSVYLFTRRVRKNFDNTMPQSATFSEESRRYKKFLSVLSYVLFGNDLLLQQTIHADHLLGHKFSNRSSSEELMFILNQPFTSYSTVSNEFLSKFHEHIRSRLSVSKHCREFIQFFCALLQVKEKTFKIFLVAPTASYTQKAGGGVIGATIKRSKNAFSIIRTGAKHYTRKTGNFAKRRAEDMANAISEHLFSKSKQAWATYFFKGMSAPTDSGAMGVRAYLMLKQKTLQVDREQNTLSYYRDYRLFPETNSNDVDQKYTDWALEQLRADVTTFTERFHGIVLKRFRGANLKNRHEDVRKRFYALFFITKEGSKYYEESSGDPNTRVEAFLENIQRLFCTTPFLYKRRALEALNAFTRVDTMALMTMIYSRLNKKEAPSVKQATDEEDVISVEDAFFGKQDQGQ